MKCRFLTVCLVVSCLFAIACGDDGGDENDHPNATTNQISSNDANDSGGNSDINSDNDTANSTTNDNGATNNSTNDTNNTNDDGPKFCRHTCQQASDCGTQAGWSCVDERCHWESDATQSICSDDEDCLAFMSGWHDSCANQDGCEITQACIEHEGQGLCAFEEGEFINCADMNREVVTRDLFGEAGQTQVCAMTNVVCIDQSYCMEACQSNADCHYPGVDTCVDGQCLCGSDAACADVDYGDVCYDGLCGCSSDQVCVDADFDVCE